MAVLRDITYLAAGPASELVRSAREKTAVSRIRYSHEQAQAEAIRRAEAFVADRPDRDEWRLRGSHPDTSVPPSHASKHAVAWIVLFAPVPPEGGVIDGGELFVAVDLESESVVLRPGL
jgi:Tfp pilus assembly protein FimT